VNVSSCSFLFLTKVSFVTGCEEKNTFERKKLLCFVRGRLLVGRELMSFYSEYEGAYDLCHSEELRDEESLMQRAEARDSSLHCASFRQNDMSVASLIEARHIVPL